MYSLDLRTNYVQFVLAFLKHGDAEVKRQLLGVKGLVSAVIAGLGEDAYQLIQEVLTTLYDNLVTDHSVPKSTKAYFFNAYILEKMAKVYSRSEPEEISQEGDTGVPANILHHFLISLCTVPGVGICFHESGWYPPARISEEAQTERITNRILAKFIIILKPSDDLLQQELVLKILAACPELVKE
jgi:hypothetical protein